MDSAEELKAKEFELKRIETVGKFIDAATERQFKLASFGLAGNVGAVAASAIAFKDYRALLDEKKHEFSDAMFLFVIGAAISTISLGVVLLSSELFSYAVTSTVAEGPTKESSGSELFAKANKKTNQATGLVIFLLLYGVSGGCFFFGLYRITAMLH